MCIYCGTNKYRKIYENHYGPIPQENNGRSYHIHHKDGDRANNRPDNLIAMPIQDHYDLHLAQEDYGAALKLGRLLHIDPESLREINRKFQSGWGVYYDADGNSVRTNKEDPRVQSGELQYANVGSKKSFDHYVIDDEIVILSTEDPRVLSGEAKHKNAVYLKYRDANGDIHHLKNDDPLVLSGEVEYFCKGVLKGKASYRDAKGTIYTIATDDPLIRELGLVNVGKGSKKSTNVCRHCGEKKSKSCIDKHERNCPANPNPSKLYVDIDGNIIETTPDNPMVLDGTLKKKPHRGADNQVECDRCGTRVQRNNLSNHQKGRKCKDMAKKNDKYIYYEST